jgi:hypothetical protein
MNTFKIGDRVKVNCDLRGTIIDILDCDTFVMEEDSNKEYDSNEDRRYFLSPEELTLEE